MSENRIELPEWRVLVNTIRTWEYGSMHTHEEIEAVLGLTRGTGSYYRALSKANKVLEDEGKKIISIHGSGYQVLEPNEYAENAVAYVNQAKRKTLKAYNVAKCAPIALMDSAVRTVHRSITDRIGAFANLMNANSVSITLLNEQRRTIVMNNNMSHDEDQEESQDQTPTEEV